MNKLIRYLKKPYPIVDKPWIIFALSAITVAFILALFQPFQYKLNSIGQLWVLVGFMIVTFMSTTLLFVILPKIFKKFFNPDTWTTGKNLSLHFFSLTILGLFVFPYDYYILIGGHSEHTLFVFSIDMLAAFTIGIIPLVISNFITLN